MSAPLPLSTGESPEPPNITSVAGQGHRHLPLVDSIYRCRSPTRPMPVSGRSSFNRSHPRQFAEPASAIAVTDTAITTAIRHL